MHTDSPSQHNGVVIPEQNEAAALLSKTHNQPATKQPATVTAPPANELAIMLDMARKGELPKLQRHAQTLAAQNPRYDAFAHSLSGLIRTYEEEKLVEL